MNLPHRFVFVALVAVVLSSCSDLRQPVQSNLQPELNVHPEGWVRKSSGNFHGLFLRQINWDLKNCQQCHGLNYAGGIAESSCLPCHPATPEDCVVCHGGVDNLTGAPPVDLEDNTSVAAKTVGSHTAHLTGTRFSDGIDCQSCHVVPGGFFDAGHVDSELPAEVVFSGLAIADSSAPDWDRNTELCSNTYCHGNWSLPKSQSNFPGFYTTDAITGNMSAPAWTDPSTVECGVCHDLPPRGHIPFELSQCATCHTVTVDAQGNILDKSKHINGNVNVFGQEYPIF